MKIPSLISIVGTDGAGKSSLAKWLVEQFLRQGIQADLRWSRFNNYLSKPLLALTRLTGHNYYRTIDGVLFGFHDFERLSGFRQIFASSQAIDVNIAAYLSITRARNQENVIVCERGPWDTLADVIVDTGWDELAGNALGRLYVIQVRTQGRVLLISRSRENIVKTRPELVNDHKLNKKIGVYKDMAERNGWAVVHNDGLLDESRKQLADCLGLSGVVP
jgi:hypothetical protein